MEVQSPPGSIIGYLRQKVTETEPTFAVTDLSNKAQLWLRGPSCAVYCTVNNAVSYQILSKDERTQVGAVVKQWMKGAAAESAGGSSSKGGKTFIQFPMDLAPKLKATLLASCFLIVSLSACHGAYDVSIATQAIIIRTTCTLKVSAGGATARPRHGHPAAGADQSRPLQRNRRA
ncbi:unnamed protein product [Lampetra fluviatilis]